MIGGAKQEGCHSYHRLDTVGLYQSNQAELTNIVGTIALSTGWFRSLATCQNPKGTRVYEMSFAKTTQLKCGLIQKKGARIPMEGVKWSAQGCTS